MSTQTMYFNALNHAHCKTKLNHCNDVNHELTQATQTIYINAENLKQSLLTNITTNKSRKHCQLLAIQFKLYQPNLKENG